MDYNEAISNLKFISRIKARDKVNVKFMFIQQDSLMTKISRTFHFENRKNTLNFVRSTINRSFEIIAAYSKSKSESKLHTCSNVIRDLKLAKDGLQNLKETYLADIKFCCDLDTILQDIDSKLIGLDIPKEEEDEDIEE